VFKRRLREERLNNYDLLMILLPSMKEDRVEEILGVVRKEIERAGGEPGAGKGMGKRVFGRPIKKLTEGRYYKLGFSLPTGEIDALKGRLRLNSDVFRFQILRSSEPMSGAAEATAESAAAGPAEEDNGQS